jgi:hypothetical protein
MTEKRYQSFGEFFPYYLSEHSNPVNRALHYVGTLGAVVLYVVAIATWGIWPAIAAPFAGYGCAWIGHFFVEKNRPATFTYPLWSLFGDFVMLFLFLTGRLGRRLPPSVVEPR